MCINAGEIRTPTHSNQAHSVPQSAHNLEPELPPLPTCWKQCRTEEVQKVGVTQWLLAICSGPPNGKAAFSLGLVLINHICQYMISD